MLGNGVQNMAPQRRYIVCKLHCNTGNKLSRMANISTASCEEKASPKTCLGVLGSDCTRYSRLASTSQTIQPEDAWCVLPICPVVYVVKQIDTSIRKAGWLMLSLICVEGRVYSVK